MKKIWILLCMFLLCSTKMITANYIKSVIPVDFLHVEVVMAEPLSKEELDTSIDLNKEPLFLFNNGIIMIGKPILQNIRGYENTYRIPVNGLDENTMYSTSYGKNKPKTFKTYTTEKEITDKYRNRYGDYF